MSAQANTGIAARPKDSFDGGVGITRQHDSARKHVSGEATYVDDIPEPQGLLHVHIAQGQVAHASITKMDLRRVAAASWCSRRFLGG